MKRVIQVSAYAYPCIGGQEQIVKLFNKVLIRRGIRPIVIQPDIAKKSKTLELLDHNVTIHFLPCPLWPILKIFIKLNSIFGFDIRFLYEWAHWIGFNIALARASKNLFREDDVVIVHYHLHASAVKSSRINKIVFSHGIEWSVPPSTITDKLRVRAARMLHKDSTIHTIIANDRSYLTALKNLSPAWDRLNHKCCYLPNSVDTHFYSPEPEYCPDKRLAIKLILVVRNVRPDRGIMEAIEAFGHFRAHDPAYRMLFVGHIEPSHGYGASCVKRSKDIGNIEFLGHASSPELLNLYRHATLSLVPSVEKEGTSLAALESMATKTPCVSTCIGGLADLPTFKACSSDAYDLFLAIVKCLDNYYFEVHRQYQETLDSFSTSQWENQVDRILSSIGC